MSILIDSGTKVLVQNITGREGQFHAERMLSYGTQVVAGTAPGREGESVAGVPVFNSVKRAVAASGADASIIFVPAPWAADAIVEAVDGGLRLVVCITEGIPVLDMVKVHAYVHRSGCRLIGPNCPGLISPGQSKVGILPQTVFAPGPVGLISRSGTLTYEVVQSLTDAGIGQVYSVHLSGKLSGTVASASSSSFTCASRLGQTTCVGIGGDPIVGSSFVDILGMLEQDPATTAIALIGEIGGSDEEEAADFIASEVTKPVVAFIAGKTAPADRRMGHAGAIVSSGHGTAAEKIAALAKAGVAIAESTEDMARMLAGLTR